MVIYLNLSHHIIIPIYLLFLFLFACQFDMQIIWGLCVTLDMALHVFDFKQFYLINFIWFWYDIMELLMFAMSNVTWIKRVSMLIKWEVSFSGCCFSLNTINVWLFTYFCIIYLIYQSCMVSIFLGANLRVPLTLSGSHLMPPAQVCTIPGVSVWSFP